MTDVHAVLALVLTSLAAAPPAGYRLRLDAGLTEAAVEFCLGARPEPVRLTTREPEAERFRGRATVTRGRARLVDTDGGIELGDPAPGTCVAYAVDLARLEREGGERALRRLGHSVLTRSDLWLWRPSGPLASAPLRLALELPAGMEASLPWPPADATGGNRSYLLTPTPRRWQDLTLFGRLSVTEIEAPGARLRLAIADGEPAADPGAMAAWLGEAARAVSTLYGRFPLASPQIVVVPIGRRGEPVPWAQVQRGGGAAAHFYVDQHRPLAEFREDWTATHELSHMLLPYVSRDGAWLSEGFASYYQNVLRARAGMISATAAWERLFAGFRRGGRATDGVTLAAATREMHRRGAYLRVYWSGAALALLADVELRRQSAGAKSLDLALARLAECCLPSERAWSAAALLGRLDELTEADVFMRLHARHVHSPAFPDLAGAAAALGIVEEGDALRFAQDDASAALRQAIMSPPTHLLAEHGQRDERSTTTAAPSGRLRNHGGPRGPAP